MSPDGQTSGTKTFVFDNLYSVLLAVVVAVVLITTAFVAYKCYFQYGTIFSMP